MPSFSVAARLVAGLTILVIVTACDSTGSTPDTTPEPTTAVDLGGTSWTLVSVGGTPVVEGSGAAMTFDAAGTVSGSTGCNSVNGPYSVDGSALTFGPLATTRMACEDALMTQETAVLAALESVSGWSIDSDGRLHLTGDSELVLVPSTT